MPQEVKIALEAKSRENSRSLTAEIVARLERSLAQEDAAAAPPGDPIDPMFLAEVQKRATEWGCSKTQALIRMTLEEMSGKAGG